MVNFKKLDYPKFDLKSELESMIKNDIIHWNEVNQICLNTTQDGPDSYLHGIGSLTKDWNASYQLENENGSIETIVPDRVPRLYEKDYNKLVSVFKGTLFEEVYNLINENFNVGRIRLMQSLPKTCLSWHADDGMRLHYPIKTQEGCLMVIENEVMHLSQDNWYITDTNKFHTAMNASKENRIHLVAAIL